jgi:hypothetical protein
MAVGSDKGSLVTVGGGDGSGASGLRITLPKA